MPVIEAQVFGKPCVTSAIEPMKSHAGGGAILVDPENGSDIQEALRNALNDAELCERTMRQRARQRSPFLGRRSCSTARPTVP